MSADEGLKEITLDGVKYVRSDLTTAAPGGTRAVLVLDRGWIFAANITRKDGRILGTNVVHVVRWESIGFDGVIANPKSNKLTLKKLKSTIDIPSDCELFCIPVPDSWGM